ncbi:MAG TPA: TonB-dependent receptor, partial [Blastocatellia bacterium]|nr:TonB-dependent receptor [Blastocatellia bacterium]
MNSRLWLKRIVRRTACIAAPLAALLMTLMLSQPGNAQVLYGSIVGNVNDTQGAVVSSATVKITNKANNQSREAITNAEGGFNFPTVQAGRYDIVVTKSGFKTASTTIEVTLNSVARADIALEVGQVSETVSVTADTALLQTDRAEVRAELTSKALLNLPIPPGRNYQQLFRSLPGINPPENAHSVPTNPSRSLQFNVNGTSRSSNNIRIDGASQYNVYLPHVTAYVPSLEAIETVNVVTNNFDAEQGLAGGAAVNVQLKSGTNNLHGSAFEYHDDNHTKARPWALTPVNGVQQDKPKRVYNQWGGTIGGPIKKDKVFYFASFEGTNDRQLGARFLTLPTAEMRRGDLSGAGTVGVYDPATGNANGTGRTAFTSNQIPTARIDPIAAQILKDLPLPNRPGFTNNYYATGSYLFDRKTLDTKVNYNVNAKLTTYGRFSFLKFDQLNPGALGPLDGVGVAPQGGNTGTATGKTYGATFAGVYTVNSNLIIDGNVGYTKLGTSSRQGFLDQKVGSDILKIPGTNGSRDFENGWPRFAISGFANLGVQDAFMPYTRNDPQWQFVTNFNWTKGTHNIRFGFDFARQKLNHLQAEWNGGGNTEPGQGGFQFGTGPTQLCTATNAAGTCSSFTQGNQFNSFATFLLGYYTIAGRTYLSKPPLTFKAQAYSGYIRDGWQVNQKLTLTLGTRWEYYPLPQREDRGIERYNFDTNQQLICGTGNNPSNCGTKLSKKLFSPRIGIAWRVSDSFVVRTGYGLTYDPISLARSFRSNYPTIIADNITAPNSAAPAGLLRNGIRPTVVPDISSGAINVPSSVNILTLDDSFRRPYIQSWNLVLEKNIGLGFTASAGYIATRTVGQAGLLDLNAGRVGGGQASQPLNIKFGRVATTTLLDGLGNSHYDSLQTVLKRRFSQGLQLQASWTWSKAIGLANLGGDNDSGLAIQDPAFRDLNRSPLSINIPHNFQFTGGWE